MTAVSGVLLTYTDVEGNTKTLSPDDHPELRDERVGQKLWMPVTVGAVATEAVALEFGRLHLAEQTRANP